MLQPAANDLGQKIIYLHNDHLGTPRKATTQKQTVVWQWLSDAFGTDAANDDPDVDGVATTINLRFPGQCFDEESGLHYNYFRDYDPVIGRYIQSDPIGLGGGANTYSYLSDNPLIFYDDDGLSRNVRTPRNVRNARIVRRNEQLRRQQQSIRDRIRNLTEKAERTKKDLDCTLDDLSNQLDNLKKQLHPDFPTKCVSWSCPWDDTMSCPASGARLEPLRSPLEGCRCRRRMLDVDAF